MKTSKIIAVSLFALALAGTGAAVATAQGQQHAGPQAGSGMNVPPRMTHFRDHHGPRGGMFGDGGMEENIRIIFMQVDANGDGSVTQDEIDSFRATKISEADVSGDGGLSIEEFDTLYREFTRERMVDAFQQLDADGDGAIVEEEMDRRFGGIVERMDRNDDGALSLQEHGRD
jgi:EF hand